MLNRKYVAIAMILIMNVAVSVLMNTYMTTSTVKSDPMTAVQTPGMGVTATGLQSTSSTAFADMPGMSLTTPFLRMGDLLVMFSAQSLTTGGGGLTIRCLVDNQVAQPGEVTIDSDAVEAHGMNFYVPNVGAGTHTVRIQWRRTGSGGTIFVDDRTLAAINILN